MGNDYKTFLGVPGSFFLHGWQWFFCSWAVPGGLWGHESGHVCDAPNIIFKPYRELPLYPRTEPHCRLPCQSNAKNVRLNSSATCAIMVQTLWMLPCMSRRVAPTLNATGPKKEASFCKKPCLASMDPLSVCVYACTRGSCVDSIWLWVRKETFSKPVFGVSKPSISGFVAVGPHCVCMLAVVVAVLIAYDYDCARTLWASWPFGGEAALARRESLQLRPCWPNIEPQMIGQKEEKKSWVARPVSQTNQRPPKPALNREGNKLWVRKLTPFLGPDLVLQTSFLRMHVHLKVNPWRIHLPCQLTRLQKHDSRSCVQLSQKIMALCPLWRFQPPILQHVFSCAQWGPTATKPEMLVFEAPKTGPMYRARLPELGLCSQDSMHWAATSAAWDWRPRVAGARMVLAETLL